MHFWLPISIRQMLSGGRKNFGHVPMTHSTNYMVEYVCIALHGRPGKIARG